jgi:hypothetical protein
MIALTSSGADAGAIASPSGPIVAFSVACVVKSVSSSSSRSPRATASRRAIASERLMRPLMRRSLLRSHERTRRFVWRPNWPSTAVGRPQAVNRRCSSFTSAPRIGLASVRDP